MRDHQCCSLWGPAHNIYRLRGAGIMVHKALGREEASQLVYSVKMSIAMSTSIKMGGMSKKKGIGQKSLTEYLLER